MNAKKKIIITSLFAAIIIAFVAQHLYFSFSGTKISTPLLSNNIASIKIVKTYETSEKSDVIEEAVLNDEQTKLLISLFNNTKFRRIVSSTVPFYDKERYVITAETSDSIVLFRLKSYGGEFVFVDSMDGISMPNHWKLRINNNEWKNTLEKIIAFSD